MPLVDPFTRRGFIVSSAAGLAGAVFARAGLAASLSELSFLDPEDFPVPADKQLDANWVASLRQRGAPTVYSAARDELKFIGMPVGGICTGQLYLGGDGKLWHWDIFNTATPAPFRGCSGANYTNPPPAAANRDIEQGFAIAVDAAAPRALDSLGFRTVTFRGQYPIATIDYADPDCPVAATLEAFSPFIPLDEDASGIPATIFRWTLRNTGKNAVKATLAGWVQNACSLASGQAGRGSRVNQAGLRSGEGPLALLCSAAAAPEPPLPARDDIVFEDWEKGTYDGWTVTGKAFGDKPRELSTIAGYQGDLNAQGKWTVNTHETRHGEDVVKADTYVGTLTSGEFTIERDWIRFRIGGGNHPGQTCINLLVDGAPVRTMTGADNNRMHLDHWNVKEFAGQKARIQIVDGHKGGWGQIGVDEIVFTDSGVLERKPLPEEPDWGTMALALLSGAQAVTITPNVGEQPVFPAAAFNGSKASGEVPFADKAPGPIGSVRGEVALAPGEAKTVTFVLAWHFAHLWWDALHEVKDIRTLGRHYGTRFKDAHEVAAHVAVNFDALVSTTRLWRDTWADSTLPHWLLERTFIPVSTAATNTCFRFSNGRFYGWEGVYSCAGTCQHVWQYAQGLARIFPRLERYLREEIDFGQSFHEDTGAMDYRGEAHRIVAHDGFAGTVMRAYREHTMSPDDSFLKHRWPRIKKACEFLMAQDKDLDGLLEGEQYNTLDTSWYGPMAWISGLYLGALRAGELMATEMGDTEFASRCTVVIAAGRQNLVDKLYDGEYFIHKPDPAHPDANATGKGCHIDQVFGQSMLWNCTIPPEPAKAGDDAWRVIPKAQTMSALRALWKYNFATDCGAYRRVIEGRGHIKGGRWYAVDGDRGLLMCTFPKGDEERAAGKSRDAWAASYFNECMHGFEHQVASHMVWESASEGDGGRGGPFSMLTMGLAITRALHDRYSARLRNPYNELECGDHYSRSMASYGTFLACCGFAYHGPRGEIQFLPRLMAASPSAGKHPMFRCPFTSAEGWGTFTYVGTPNSPSAMLEVKWGQLRLTKATVPYRLADKNGNPMQATLKVLAGEKTVQATFTTDRASRSATVTFNEPITVRAGSQVSLSWEL